MAPVSDQLHISHAREHNLKEVSLKIPHDRLTVVTGLSGSGKSSLAFDTVYAEGQRRYIETFSPYTRQFFDKVKKPDVDAIDNVRPAIAIQQRTRVTSSRSTVGSLTDINDYLKVLWSNIATPVCPNCGIELKSYSAPVLAQTLLQLHQLKPGSTFLICARLLFRPSEPKKSGPRAKARPRTETQSQAQKLFISCLTELAALGFSRVFNRVIAEAQNVEDFLSGLGDTLPSEVLLVLDRIKSGSSVPNGKRLIDSVEQAYALATQTLPPHLKAEPLCVVIEFPQVGVTRPFLRIANTPEQANSRAFSYLLHAFSQSFHCPANVLSIPKPRPSLFSYNHPIGACPECKGFGKILAIAPELCVPNPNISIRDKALQCWAGKAARSEYRDLLQFCTLNQIPLDRPWKELSSEQRSLIFDTKTKQYWGVIPWFKWLERKIYKMHVRVFLSRYRAQITCPTCHGTRLKPQALAFQVQGKILPDLWNMPVGALHQWVTDLLCGLQKASSLSRPLAETILATLSRLKFLCDLGLSYLTLDRQARTLSGGETQRVNLATALGSDLISTHFVLDEPSVGLHPRDTGRLIESIRTLTAKGNSLLVVEHDLDCIQAADNIIELGPGAGEAGGQVVYSGEASGWPGIAVTPDPRLQNESAPSFEKKLGIRNARCRNLKGFDLDIPLDAFVCLTGVSGSGKSTLVSEVIKKSFERQELGLESASDSSVISGFEHVSQVLLVDQSPVSKTPRANIATYTGMWDQIRDLLADCDDAHVRALGRSAFSFNVDGGRCPECKGAGFIREDMQFLSDVFITCEMCLGKRFQPPVLEVKYKGKSVADILELTTHASAAFFHDRPALCQTAEILCLLGLGHLSLGHSLSELSGGEAQRLKLIPFVQRSGLGRSLLIFDEPTTGLHYEDVTRLIELFRSLRDRGHSVLCIEHNLALIAACDWIIDLGPEGGELGGRLMLQGTPAQFVAQAGTSASYTARFLKAFAARKAAPLRSKSGSTAARSESAATLDLRGAREHNLKNISLSIPLGQFVALSGVSGSGKSTIAKDIIYAEGQRRYLDCLSPYARQFIKELKKPDIDELKNVKPTICVYQHTFQPSRLSTVATMSEIYNFLRLLFAKTGIQYCPDHPQHPIAPMTPTAIASEIKKISEKTVRILAPVVKMKKGHHRAILERAIASEIPQVRVDGVFVAPSTVNLAGGLLKTKVHTIEFVVGRFNPAQVDLPMIEDAVIQALSLAAGVLIVHTDKGETVFSTERTCPVCKRGFFKPDPEDLSFNSKRGACASCHGAGVDTAGGPCAECRGARINALGRNLRIGGKSIFDLSSLNACALLDFLQSFPFTKQQAELATPILRELHGKAHTLIGLGLEYLALSRDCASLSSGELQRLRLATAMGSALSGVMYIFDEPSAGLHPLDNHRVLEQLSALKACGNSVLMIEHDTDSILAADYVIDVGPGGGSRGGEIVYSGPLRNFLRHSQSATAQALRQPAGLGTAFHGGPTGESPQLKIEHACVNNLRGLCVSIPLGALVTVAGVSGAGKSSLVRGVIYESISKSIQPARSWINGLGSLRSDIEISRAIEVDQRPIGINSRSTPASYLKIWDEIRKLFASTNEARARGWAAGFFSYNSGKGRCGECRGLGQIMLEMSFLPDAQVLCEACLGSRYTDEANSVRYLGLSISDVLRLTFDEARLLFANHRRIHRALHLACELGLGYLTLGQSSTTLSGGESQRIKLTSELYLGRKGHTLYILDEPTTGLHKSDVARLMKTLRELVARGNSVLIIEHDPDVLCGSDYILELGPGPGDQGGRVIFQGPAAELATATTPWAEVFRATRDKGYDKPAAHFDRADGNGGVSDTIDRQVSGQGS